MAIDNDFNKLQYDANTQEYLDTNTDQHIGGGNAESRARLIKDYLPAGSSVLEIGSGGGEDAVALSEEGYVVTASDFSKKFVGILRSKGLSAILFDAKTDNFPSTYDAVYANAVFVHFAPDEISAFLQKAIEALKDPKLIFLSVLSGNTQERRTGSNIAFERDFQDYSEDMLNKILKKAGFNIKHIDLVDKRWLQVVATLPND